SLGQASRNAVFTPAARRPWEVFTGALPIDHVVHRGAVALAGDFRLAPFEQLDIAVEDDRYGFVDAAVALGQGLLGLGGDLRHSLTPCGSGWRPEVWSGNLFPRERRNCYHDTD